MTFGQNINLARGWITPKKSVLPTWPPRLFESFQTWKHRFIMVEQSPKASFTFQTFQFLWPPPIALRGYFCLVYSRPQHCHPYWVLEMETNVPVKSPGLGTDWGIHRWPKYLKLQRLTNLWILNKFIRNWSGGRVFSQFEQCLYSQDYWICPIWLINLDKMGAHKTRQVTPLIADPFRNFWTNAMMPFWYPLRFRMS